MYSAGYLAKRVSLRPDWLKAHQVTDIYSVSGCVSQDFADYVEFWKHNGFWLFDSPEVIQNIAHEKSIDLAGNTLFYYELYEKEFDGETWHVFGPDLSFTTHVEAPTDMNLEGFDVVTFTGRNLPEHSPLSCNNLAEEIPTNPHCLLNSFDEAEAYVSRGIFNGSEPGPYRIFSVSSVKWPTLRRPKD